MPSHNCGRHAWACRERARRYPVQGPGARIADLDDALLAVLAADGDLPLPRVQIATLRIYRVATDPGQFRSKSLTVWWSGAGSNRRPSAFQVTSPTQKV